MTEDDFNELLHTFAEHELTLNLVDQGYVVSDVDDNDIGHGNSPVEAILQAIVWLEDQL